MFGKESSTVIWKAFNPKNFISLDKYLLPPIFSRVFKVRKEKKVLFCVYNFIMTVSVIIFFEIVYAIVSQVISRNVDISF